MTYWLPAILSLLSLSGLIVGAKKKPEKSIKGDQHISRLLGFSSGLILYTAMGEALPIVAEQNRMLYFFVFFMGMLLNFGLSHLMPDAYDPHEGANATKEEGRKTILSLSYHSLQETLIVFGMGLYSVPAAVLMALAAFFHHIPEGRGVNRRDALLATILSGAISLLAICLVCFLIGCQDLSLFISLCSGMAVCMTLDELLPAARRYGQHHTMIGGMIGGMMLASFLILFAPIIL